MDCQQTNKKKRFSFSPRGVPAARAICFADVFFFNF